MGNAASQDPFVLSVSSPAAVQATPCAVTAGMNTAIATRSPWQKRTPTNASRPSLERDRQRQLAATAQLQDQVAKLQRQLATRQEPSLTTTYDNLLTLLRPEIERGTITVEQSEDQSDRPLVV